MERFFLVISCKMVCGQLFAPMLPMMAPMMSPMMPPIMPPMMPQMYPMNGMFNYFGHNEYHPILDIASSIAKIVELKKTEDVVEMEQMRSRARPMPTPERISPPSDRPNLQLIPYASIRGHPSSSIVNSIPLNKLPSDVFKIGDLMTYNNKHDREFVYDLEKLRGSPILKGSETGSFPIVKEESHGIRGIDVPKILRKVLGLDELPTKSEGNAIAQLIDQ